MHAMLIMALLMPPRPPAAAAPNARQCRIISAVAGTLGRAVLARAAQLPGSPVTLPDVNTLAISWTSSFRSGAGTLWRIGANEWTCQVGDDYYLLHYGTIVYSAGIPSTADVQLVLETRGGTIWSPLHFTLDSSAGSPFSVVYSALNTPGWGNSLTVTITGP